MDISGNNRYELLFMDDEGSPSIEQEVAQKKKIINSSNVETVKRPQKKVKCSAEKENKDANKLKNEKKAACRIQSISKISTKAGNQGNRATDFAGNELESRDAFKGHTNEIRQQRNNNIRGNIREGDLSNKNDFGGNDQQQRQIRRDNKSQMRNNRFGDGGFRGGKREFDRQSGSDKTGIKAIDKRDGAGAHNWGSVKQEIDEINKSATDVEITQLDKDDSSNEQTTDQSAIQEEESKEMTLDEWKAITQREKPKYNLRKAGEGEDTTQWKKMVVLDKKNIAGDNEEELEYDPSMYPQRVGRLQRIVDIQFNFNDSRRGGFGRGRGRGGRLSGNNGKFPVRFDSGRIADNGRSNPGRPRFGQIQRAGYNQLKVDDERQFPTLS